MRDLLKLFSPKTLEYFCPGRLALFSLPSLPSNNVDDLHPEKECNNCQSSYLRKVIRFYGQKIGVELTTLSQVALSTTGGQQKS